MTYARYQFAVQDKSGNVLPGAEVRVQQEAAGFPLATLYLDLNGTEPAGNPVYADDDGWVYFHAAGGQYKVTIRSGTYSRILRYVQVGVAAGEDGATPGLKLTYAASNADGDPGNGIFRLNSSDLTAVTEAYLDDLDANGASIAAYLDTWDDYGQSSNRGTVELRCIADPSKFAAYKITGTVTDAAGYKKLTLIHLASAGPFTGDFVFGFLPAGADGTDGLDGADGADGITPAVTLAFDSATSGDPGAGKFGLNNADLTLASEIRIDNLDAFGANISAYVDSFGLSGSSTDRGTIEFRDISDPSKFFLGKITGSVTDSTGYRTLSVTHTASAGPLSASCAMFFVRTGNTGASGAGTGTVNPTGTIVTDRIAVFDGTSGEVIKDGGYTIAGLTSYILGLVRDGVSGAFDTLNEIAAALAGKLTASSNLSDLANVGTARTNLGLGTGDSPQFAGIQLGDANDNTLVRSGAGRATLEGAEIRLAGVNEWFIPAHCFAPRTSNGCAALATFETTTNKGNFPYLAFDATTQEFAQTIINRMPKSWNEGTITASPQWMHPSTTTNFGVVFGVSAVALSNDDAADTAFGTAQTSTDTGGTTHDVYHGPDTSAITIANSPAEGDTIIIQVSRNPSDGSDTMAVDAWFLGLLIRVTTNAANDA